MIVVYSLLSVLFAIVAVLLTKALSPKNIHKKWLTWLLRGSGSQVDEALGFLNHIKAFELEEKNGKEGSS